MCKKANFYARFDMYSRSLKATAKVQGASIISLLQNQYGESGLFKVILVKIRKHAILLWFSGHFLYCVACVSSIQFQIYRLSVADMSQHSV